MGKLEAIIGSLLLCFLAFSGLETKTEHGMLVRINSWFSLKKSFANTHSFILQFQNSCLVLSPRKLRDFEFFVSIWTATFVLLEPDANMFGLLRIQRSATSTATGLAGHCRRKHLGHFDCSVSQDCLNERAREETMSNWFWFLFEPYTDELHLYDNEFIGTLPTELGNLQLIRKEISNARIGAVDFPSHTFAMSSQQLGRYNVLGR
jgi:hypothetical protein